MNLECFEKFIQTRGMKIIERQDVKDLKVLFCEGYANPDLDCREPHWKMVYGIFEGDTPFIGEFFTVPFADASTKEDRLAAARGRAEEIIRNFYENGQRRKVN